jgi:hypothetical protein
MSWTSLFKSKSTKLKPDSRVRWFGKLPTYPDYYSSSPDESWAVEFNEWVIKGFELYQARHESWIDSAGPTSRRLPKIPIAAGALRLPKSEMTVLTSIMDFGGDMRGRPFPLCLYVGIPTSFWPGPTSNAVCGAAQAIRDLGDMGREIPYFLNHPGRFETLVDGRTVDLSGIAAIEDGDWWIAEAESLSMDTWFSETVSGLKVEDLRTWVGLASRWGDHIAGLENKKFQPTLRFPLARSISHEVQTAGWIRWLEQRMNLKRRSVSLVLSGDPAKRGGRLAVVARDLVPDDFLLLTERWATLPYVDDLSEVDIEEHESRMTGPPGDGGAAAHAMPETWRDFVEMPATAT